MDEVQKLYYYLSVGGISAQSWQISNRTTKPYAIIERCCNTGNINVSYAIELVMEPGTEIDNRYNYITLFPDIAGIVARTDGYVIDCFNSGDFGGKMKTTGLYKEYKELRISVGRAAADVGGIVSYMWSNEAANEEGPCIKNCYNVGEFNIDTTKHIKSVNYGEIVGSVESWDKLVKGEETQYGNPCTFENLYYIKDRYEFGDILGPDSVVIKKSILPRTKERMHDTTSYRGFDFNNVWMMPTEGEYQFPTLRCSEHNMSEWVDAGTGVQTRFCHSCGYTESRATTPDGLDLTKYTNPFSDVNDNDWFRDSVCLSADLGLVNGVTDTEFKPEGSLTIAETIKLAACMNQYYRNGEVTLVNGSINWYDTYIEYAISHSIIRAGEYENLKRAATRKEFARIFHAALPDSEYVILNNNITIPDITKNEANAEAIYTLYHAGILTGDANNGAFRPNDAISRAEAATIIVRMVLPVMRIAA